MVRKLGWQKLEGAGHIASSQQSENTERLLLPTPLLLYLSSPGSEPGNGAINRGWAFQPEIIQSRQFRRHVQSPIFQVILDSVKLTMNTSYYRAPEE